MFGTNIWTYESTLLNHRNFALSYHFRKKFDSIIIIISLLISFHQLLIMLVVDHANYLAKYLESWLLFKKKQRRHGLWQINIYTQDFLGRIFASPSHLSMKRWVHIENISSLCLCLLGPWGLILFAFNRVNSCSYK